MAWIDYAAMDPIFFLHHTNIDRLFAIWQAIHPATTWNSQYQNQYGTYGIPAGTEENANTALTPFRWSATDYFTSNEVWSTLSLGYAYPETDPSAAPADQFQAWVMAKANELYGNGSPAGILTQVSSSASKTTTTKTTTKTTAHTTTKTTTTTTTKKTTTTAAHTTTKPTTTTAKATTTHTTTKSTTTTHPVTTAPPAHTPAPPSAPAPGREKNCNEIPEWEWIFLGRWQCWISKFSGHHKRDFDISEISQELGSDIDKIVSNAIDTIPPIADLVHHVENLITDGNMYTEYIAEIKSANNALAGSYNVFFFCGDYSSDPSQWPTDPNLIGTHSILSAIGGGHYYVGGGSIPLTATLIAQVAAGKLKSLRPSDAVPFLEKNLRWEVATIGGKSVPADQVQDFKVQVFSAPVRLPCVDGSIPKWGGSTIEYSITEGKAGGICTGEHL